MRRAKFSARLRKATFVLLTLSVLYFKLLYNREHQRRNAIGVYESEDEDEEEEESFYSFNPQTPTIGKTRTNASYFLKILQEEELKEKALALDLAHEKPQLQNDIFINLTILTMNVKAAPVNEIKYTLESFGVHVIDININDKHARNRLKLPADIFSLESDAINTFYSENIDNPLITSSHAFLCIYPIVLCRLFLRFNKPLIIYIEDRYEAGSHRYNEWTALNKVIKTTSHDSRSSILASNTYDSEYVRFFTGIAPMPVPFTCAYVGSSQASSPTTPISGKFLLWSVVNKQVIDWFMDQLKTALSVLPANDVQVDVMVDMSRDQYRASLSSYSAVIVLPHQVSSLPVTELYRMNVPLFIPSLDLATDLHQKQKIFSHKR